MRFCFRLGHFSKPEETVFRQGAKFFCFLRYFQKEEIRLKMKYEEEGSQRQKLTKISTEFVFKSSVNSQNDRERVEFDSHYHSSVSDQ